MKIIADAMGGDHAPQAVVSGVCMAVREFGCDAVLTGDREAITAILRSENMENSEKIQIVHTDSVIGMEEDPSEITHSKKESSMAVGLKLLAAGEGDAFVGAGSTGALLTGATLFVKRIRGIRRAALAPILPTAKGGALLIDSGANVECTPEYLLQFGLMGACYMGLAHAIPAPKVALLNIGAEPEKGGPLHVESWRLLKEASDLGQFSFIGNIEGRDVMNGNADVIVADGFSGNVLLKTTEGVGLYFAGVMKKLFMANLRGKLAAMLVLKGIKAFKKSMDYKEIGGAPLLGISKPVIKAHGSADAYAFRSAIKQAIRYAQSGIIADIAENAAKQKAGEASDQSKSE